MVVLRSSKMYTWSEGSRINADAQVVGKELERLAKGAGGSLKAGYVVEQAKDSSSILHSLFEWDDEVAARLHREDYARYLMRSIRIEEVTARGETTQTLAFVHADGAAGNGYFPISKIMKSEELRSSALKEAGRMLSGIRKRYIFLRELHPVFEAIKVFLEEQEQREAG